MKKEGENQYSHTQIGWLVIAIMGFAIVSIIFIMSIVPYNFITLTPPTIGNI